MRNFKFRNLLFLMLTSNHIFCQLVNFSHSYSSLLEFQSFAVTQAPDGGYVMAGAMSYINGSDFTIVKTDRAGNIQWVRGGNRFDGVNYASKMFSIVYVDNYYYLAGQIVLNMGNNEIKGYFVKCDTLGNIIWDKIDSRQLSYSSKIVKSNDGNLLFTGLVVDTAFGSQFHSWFGKIDTAGNELWSEVIQDTMTLVATNITEINNNLIISAISRNDTGTGIINGSHMYSIDSLGNSLWKFGVQDTSNNGITDFVLDSGFIYVGLSFSINFYNNNLYNSSIIKLDSSGNVIWVNDMHNLQYRGRGDNMTLSKTSDNNIIAVCRGLNYLKVTNAGNDLWTLEQDTINYQVYQTIVNDAGHFISTGHYKISGLTDISFLTDVSDDSVTSTFYMRDEIGLKVFPNPFMSGIFLYSNWGNNDVVNIYNVLGALLLSDIVHKGKNYIDVSQFNDGIYFLEILNSNRKHVFKITKSAN